MLVEVTQLLPWQLGFRRYAHGKFKQIVVEHRITDPYAVQLTGLVYLAQIIVSQCYLPVQEQHAVEVCGIPRREVDLTQQFKWPAAVYFRQQSRGEHGFGFYLVQEAVMLHAIREGSVRLQDVAAGLAGQRKRRWCDSRQWFDYSVTQPVREVFIMDEIFLLGISLIAGKQFVATVPGQQGVDTIPCRHPCAEICG